jgi:hypothetical protein
MGHITFLAETADAAWKSAMTLKQLLG